MTIKKNDEFEAIYPILNLNGLTFLDIVDLIEREVVKKSVQPITQGSLNNCRGTWHELAFVMEAHRSILRSTKDLYIIKMGNESSIKFWEIYNQESRRKYQSLVERLQHKNDPIVIRCSTPDFVVVSRDIILNSTSSQILESESPSLQEINELYKVIKNNYTPDRVKGFISLKTSNRPDRRYQILVEANVTKFASKYIHSSDYPLRFDVIGESNSSDIEVFKAPLMPTLSLTLDEDIALVERAIDGETNITSSSQLDSYWERYK
jgi:Cfr10I/Bse634I restriction endonuclease